jgi:hypothetical protein
MAMVIQSDSFFISDFLEIFFYLALEYTGIWFGFSCLALFLSLRCKRNSAFGICVLVFLLWNTIGKALFIEAREGIFFIDFIAYIMMGGLCLGGVHGSLRTHYSKT